MIPSDRDRCTWPKGCMVTAYGGGLCYYHEKQAAGMFDQKDNALDALNPADVVSDTQMEIAALMRNLDASPDQVRKALAKERW